MCTLGAISGQFLFKNRDMGTDAGTSEDLVRGKGQLNYVGVAGHASPLERGLNSGINEAGVAAAITFTDHKNMLELLKSRTPRGVLVEEILGHASDLQSALHIALDFLHFKPLIGGNIVILTPDEGAVIEQIYPRFAIEYITQPYIARTNHFLNLRTNGHLAVNQASSQDRLRRIGSLLEEKHGNGEYRISVDDIKGILSDHEGIYPICSHQGDLVTVSSSIYDIQERALYYAYGNPCGTTFTKYVV